jgi:hypothetical protein
MHHRTLSPEAEMAIAPPRLIIGWEPFAWIGHRRLAKDWRFGQIRDELHEEHFVVLSEDSIERYISRYQTMLAAHAQDPHVLAETYRNSPGVVLSIDGLQPEKGHETLYVVRELTSKRIWFAVPLLSSAASEVARLLVQAKEWAERLDKPRRSSKVPHLCSSKVDQAGILDDASLPPRGGGAWSISQW